MKIEGAGLDRRQDSNLRDGAQRGVHADLNPAGSRLVPSWAFLMPPIDDNEISMAAFRWLMVPLSGVP